MIKITFAASAFAVLMSTIAIAGPVEDTVARLTAEGYTNIEIEIEGALTEIEGYLNGMEREITLNAETGEILRDKTTTDDDQDEEDSDENDDA